MLCQVGSDPPDVRAEISWEWLQLYVRYFLKCWTSQPTQPPEGILQYVWLKHEQFKPEYCHFTQVTSLSQSRKSTLHHFRTATPQEKQKLDFLHRQKQLQMPMFQLEKGLHYHSPGEEQYISQAGHWIFQTRGWGDLVNHETADWFSSLYLQKLAAGWGKSLSLCTLMNVILSQAHLPPVFYFLWLTFGNMRYICEILEKEEHYKQRSKRECGFTWKRALPVESLRVLWGVWAMIEVIWMSNYIASEDEEIKSNIFFKNVSNHISLICLWNSNLTARCWFWTFNVGTNYKRMNHV